MPTSPLFLACEEADAVRRQILEQLQELGEEWAGSGQEGSLLYVLAELYARMLCDTARRINLTAQKHRLAFLNLQQSPRQNARAARAVLAFQTAEGYDAPVRLPAGTLASAHQGGRDILFRTRFDLEVIPWQIQDVIWMDRRLDAVKNVLHNGNEPFLLWDEAERRQRGRHLLRLTFCLPLIPDEEGYTAYLHTQISLKGERLEASILAQPDRFGWSLLSLPEEGEPCEYPLAVQLAASDTLCLSFAGRVQSCPSFQICLELLDASLCGLCFDLLYLFSFRNQIQPQQVLFHDSAVEQAQRFYPFGNPLQPAEECYLFCEEALARPGAEVTLQFDLEVEVEEFELPEDPKPQLKWVMREPEPKPKPEPAQAFARQVRWDYWDGSIFRPLSVKEYSFGGFSSAQPGAYLVFDCPLDLQPGEAGGKRGYFLRLSSGLCDALYQMPRRVYTPRLENLRFSYCYRTPLPPAGAVCENFGERAALDPTRPMFPFWAPPYEQALCIGFERLSPNVRVQFFFECALPSEPAAREERLCAELYQGETALPTDDGTAGLTQSGVVSVLLPEYLPKARLFGRERYWLCFPLGKRMPPQEIEGIFLNALWAENRVRHTWYSSFDELPRDGVIYLPHGNITQIWLFVRSLTGGGWERWQEYTPKAGEFRDGYYQVDCQTGQVILPESIFARSMIRPSEDFVGITYDTCDGAAANLQAGAIDHLCEEVPFISSVSSLTPSQGGMDSEPDEQFSQRLEHALYHGGRAVTARDFELIALERCPQIHAARCLPGRPIRLVVLLKEPQQSFAPIRLSLLREFERIGCAAALGTQTEIVRPTAVPMRCEVVFCSQHHIFGDTLRQIADDLRGFLHPVTGGTLGQGWPIGRLPNYVQIDAFLRQVHPQLQLIHLSVTAQGGGFYGDWRALAPQQTCIPGPVQVKVEVQPC